MAVYPRVHATWRGVSSSSFSPLMSAPASSNKPTASGFLKREAQWRGVSPWISSHWFTSSPRSMSARRYVIDATEQAVKMVILKK